MKLRALIATAVLGAATSLTSVHAQAPDPCTLYLCMAGISGYGTSGAGCTAPIAYWHATTPAGLAVYDEEGFDSGASAALRRTYMTTGCKEASIATNATILEAIMSQHGYLP